jgi:hypothetical protein
VTSTGSRDLPNFTAYALTEVSSPRYGKVVGITFISDSAAAQTRQTIFALHDANHVLTPTGAFGAKMSLIAARQTKEH